MAKELRCRDLGTECDKVIRAETEEEVLRLAGDHAAADHGLDINESQMIEEVRAQIRTVD